MCMKRHGTIVLQKRWFQLIGVLVLPNILPYCIEAMEMVEHLNRANVAQSGPIARLQQMTVQGAVEQENLCFRYENRGH